MHTRAAWRASWRFRSKSIFVQIGSTFGDIGLIALRSSYEQSIDTARQLAERDWEWGATHDAWIFSILLATQVLIGPRYVFRIIANRWTVLPILQPDIRKLLGLFRPWPAEDLHARTTTGDFSFSIERLAYGKPSNTPTVRTSWRIIRIHNPIFHCVRALRCRRLHRRERHEAPPNHAQWYLLRVLRGDVV